MRYYENDFTAFESHFSPEILRNVECTVYEAYLSKYPKLARYITRTISGTNRLHTKCGIKVNVEGRRMSGDMCTSLGNGITNYLLALYIVSEKGGSLHGFVEGDDGLFATEVEMTAEDYAQLGFTVKIVEHEDPLEAHFCGMTCSSELEVLKDPRRVFQTFGWTHSFISAGNRVMDSLLKSKALSLCYELPQCPIVGELARVSLELADGVSLTHVESAYGHYHPDEFDIEPFAPSDDARLRVERLFSIPIETQLLAEQAIREHDIDELAKLVPNVWLGDGTEAANPGLHQENFIDRYIEVG